MLEQFVNFEIASELKELGFDESCLAYYTTGTDVTLDKDGNPTNFVLLSAKLRGELVGHGSVKNNLFKWLLEHDRTSGELYTLSRSITAPLWQQAIDWFRTNYDIHIGLTPYTNPAKGIVDVLYEYTISTKENSYEGGIENSIARLSQGLETKKPSYINLFNTYEDAREQAILKVIELCKK